MTVGAWPGDRGCLIGVMLALALGLGCCGLGAGTQLWLPRLAGQPGHVVKACVSVRTSRSFRVAVWRGPPTGRTGAVIKPFIQSNIACALAPWTPFLPRNGAAETSR
jgi:hypothetical protein